MSAAAAVVATATLLAAAFKAVFCQLLKANSAQLSLRHGGKLTSMEREREEKRNDCLENIELILCTVIGTRKEKGREKRQLELEHYFFFFFSIIYV